MQNRLKYNNPQACKHFQIPDNSMRCYIFTQNYFHLKSFRQLLKAVLLSCMIAAVLFLSKGNASAQSITDSTRTSKIDSATRLHSPKKATLLSAIIPGAGQFYNKKYWKVPIILGGFAIMVAVINFDQNNYRTFKRAYAQSILHDSTPVPGYSLYSTADLLELRDYYRRNRDYTYILAGLLYVLNIVDAYVDAELFRFDISDDLSLRGEPFILSYPGNTTTAGLRLTLNFK